MDVVNKDTGPEPLSVNVAMETDAGVAESEADFTDTAEPAAAGQKQKVGGGEKESGISVNPDRRQL